ncbi:MAG: hypothetical protein DMF90_16145 [Acidobacteria bacterium]|nr:MAG: hypothetical protein DMF90_16145 [Acidobacteriota bacterium]
MLGGRQFQESLQLWVFDPRIRHQVSGIQLSAISSQRSALSDQLSAISSQRSALSDQLSAISSQRSALSDQLSAISLAESCQLIAESFQHRAAYLARGFGRIWNFRTFGSEPLPPSMCHEA